LAPFSKTADFSKDKLFQLKNYKGLYVDENRLTPQLFGLFKRK
jgi:hypothetical protein